jgi:S1-C subfamily serine protease
VKLDINFNQQRAEALGLTRLVGTRVSQIEPQSPAEKANLRINDVILEFNGVRIEQDMHLISLVKLTEIGRRVPITILREGKLLRTEVKIGNAGSIAALAGQK